MEGEVVEVASEAAPITVPVEPPPDQTEVPRVALTGKRRRRVRVTPADLESGISSAHSAAWVGERPVRLLLEVGTFADEATARRWLVNQMPLGVTVEIHGDEEIPVVKRVLLAMDSFVVEPTAAA